MATDVKFFKGNAVDLPSQQITSGQVYFVVSDETDSRGQIYLDNGSKRYLMDGGSTTGYATCKTISLNSNKSVVLTKDDWIPIQGSTLLLKSSSTNKATCPTFTIYKSDGTTALLANIPVYIGNSQILLEDLEKAGHKDYILEFLFDGAAFKYVSGLGDESKGRYYDINKKDYCVDTKKILANNLIGQNASGKLIPLTSTPSLLHSPIYLGDTDLAIGATGSEANLYSRHYNILLLLDEQELNGEPYSPLYLTGTIAQGFFIPSSTNPFANELPTSNTTLCYMYIGDFTTSITFSGNHSYISLNTEHPIYTFTNNELNIYSPPVSLEHSLTIGTYVFDGKEDVTVPIYDGTMK